jgi:hypothetical protein
METVSRRPETPQPLHPLRPTDGPSAHRLRQRWRRQEILLLAVDNSFCNRTVFRTPVQGVELIARTRKNAVLCRRTNDGSRRFYDRSKFTPEQVRLDESRAWQTTKIFYGGKRRKVEYKVVAGIYWQGGARQRPLRLLVVRPTRYQKKKSGRYYYRQPAYLLTTVVHGTVRQLLQIYFDRWQIVPKGSTQG